MHSLCVKTAPTIATNRTRVRMRYRVHGEGVLHGVLKGKANGGGKGAQKLRNGGKNELSGGRCVCVPTASLLVCIRSTVSATARCTEAGHQSSHLCDLGLGALCVGDSANENKTTYITAVCW